MNERPILFGGEMVRAILEGRKTQTRQICNSPVSTSQNHLWHSPMVSHDGAWWLPFEWSPFGTIGDRLWVRETWAHDDPNCQSARCGNVDHIWYRASEAPIVADSFAGSASWRPSIHMPRWASRITLEIVNVRVERVQDIREFEAEKEGVIPTKGMLFPHSFTFVNLWNDLYAARGSSWDANPWVWVIEFKTLKAKFGESESENSQQKGEKQESLKGGFSLVN